MSVVAAKTTEAASGSSGGGAPELKSEREIIARFQEMRQSIAEAAAKISDLEAEAHEHELVIKTLSPMDKARKCYRLVGEVLVQRTVGETLPAVERNKAGIDGVVARLKDQLESQQKQLQEFQTKYKIRMQGQDGGSGAAGGSGGQASKPGANPQGVLVS